MTGGPIVKTHRSTHVCTSGCACRSWECAECGTRELVDRRARYECEGPAPDQYGVELCDACGAPLCDQCVLAGNHGACPGRPARPRKPLGSMQAHGFRQDPDKTGSACRFCGLAERNPAHRGDDTL